jgi:hypothetical protein
LVQLSDLESLTKFGDIENDENLGAKNLKAN